MPDRLLLVALQEAPSVLDKEHPKLILHPIDHNQLKRQHIHWQATGMNRAVG